MNSVEVLEHRQAVISREHQAILANLGDISEAASGLRSTSRALGEFDKQVLPSGGRYIWPRISFHLFEEAFDDLRHYKNLKKSFGRLTQFVNGVVMPMAGISEPHSLVKGELSEVPAGACDKAEGFFVDALRQVNDSSYRGQPRISVYYSADGTPLAFRKAEDVSTALILEPTEINQVIVPAGTIAGVNSRMNWQQEGGVNVEGSAGSFSLSAYRVDGPVFLNPLRLSPWACDDVMDRSLFATYPTISGGMFYDRSKGEIAETYSLNDFRTAAHRVITLCDVEI